jgi:flagellar FliL protein
MATEKAAPPATKPAAAAEAPPKKKRSKWLLIGLAFVVVLAGGGAGAWYWLRASPPGDPADAAKAAPKPDNQKPPIFVAVEAFTVNLQAEGGEHLLQTAFSLKVADARVEQALKLHMPEIRSRLLLLLSSKRASELISVSGKEQLAGQIGAEVNRVLHPAAANPAAGDPPAEKGPGTEPANAAGKSAEPAPEPARAATAPGPVLSVFFTSFIIQ